MVDGYTPPGLLQGGASAATTVSRQPRSLLDLRWNEYAFAFCSPAVTRKRCRPSSVHHREGGQDWPAVAADDVVFHSDPFFTILLRRHLLRGITFGGCANDRKDRTIRIKMAALAPSWPLQTIAMALIGLGVVMLMQPLSLNLYTIPSSPSWLDTGLYRQSFPD